MRKEDKMNRAEIQPTLEALPALYSTDGMKTRPVKMVIYHMFSRWTWYVVEGKQMEDGDWFLFSFCRSGLGEDCDEWGYVTLNQFNEIPYIRAYAPEKMMIDQSGNVW